MSLQGQLRQYAAVGCSRSFRSHADAVEADHRPALQFLGAGSQHRVHRGTGSAGDQLVAYWAIVVAEKALPT